MKKKLALISIYGLSLMSNVVFGGWPFSSGDGKEKEPFSEEHIHILLKTTKEFRNNQGTDPRELLNWLLTEACVSEEQTEKKFRKMIKNKHFNRNKNSRCFEMLRYAHAMLEEQEKLCKQVNEKRDDLKKNPTSENSL